MTANSAEPVIAGVRSGDIESAIGAARKLSLDDYQEALLIEAFDHQSLACYGVYVGLLLEAESAERHVAASELLSLALNVLPGGYQLSFLHARRAVALAPDNVSYLEHLLSFHNSPEHLLSPTEARAVARQVLRLDATNSAGREVLRAAGEDVR